MIFIPPRVFLYNAIPIFYAPPRLERDASKAQYPFRNESRSDSGQILPRTSLCLPGGTARTQFVHQMSASPEALSDFLLGIIPDGFGMHLSPPYDGLPNKQWRQIICDGLPLVPKTRETSAVAFIRGRTRMTDGC